MAIFTPVLVLYSRLVIIDHIILGVGMGRDETGLRSSQSRPGYFKWDGIGTGLGYFRLNPTGSYPGWDRDGTGRDGPNPVYTLVY